MTGSESDALLATAEEALVAGRWAEARDGFRAALDVRESGAALFGLGLALWWLREPAESIRLQERAYRVLRRSGDHEHAFFAAMYLCLGYDMTFGNASASRGWLAKLSRLAKDHGLTGLEGWVLLCRAVVDHDRNPAAAERWAQRALDIALVSGDADLDVCAKSELGAAMIELGRLSDGAELLDEAMAGALGGEVETLDSVVLASCRTIISCSRAADVKRAAQWIRAASNFNERYGSPHLYTTCRIHYAALLILSGHWGQAEDELNEVLAVGALVEPLLHAEALSLLASLRLAQGRVEEAERLIAGFEQYSAVGAVLAAIRAAQGQFEVACWLVRRRLSGLRQNCLEAAQMLALLIDFEIAAGEPEEAIADAQRLVAMTVSTDIPMMKGRSYHALGSALCAVGDVKATGELERARTVFVELGMPYEAARSRLALARQIQDPDREAAVEEAKGALATFAELGATPEADAALALLRTLGVRTARRGPNALGALTTREREIFALLAEGLSNREIATRLYITPKTVEHHVGHVLMKLNLRRRSEAAAYAVRHGSDK